MIKPSSGASAVFQLNMGEGKSSVVIPLVATSLADSTNLVRVVVLRPLFSQMFQTLVSRLAGLSNRRIFYLPFSRQTPMTQANVQLIQNILQECVQLRGILIAQPEHILSFKLMRTDLILKAQSDTMELIQALQRTYRWINARGRDILDESDEILHVRYQLIYTSGQQRMVEDSPDRWVTVQQILHRASIHATSLRAQYQHDIHIIPKPGSFPILRLTGTSALRACTLLIALDVLDGRVENISLPALSGDAQTRSDSLQFMTSSKISEVQYEVIRKKCGDTSVWKGLLLVRGLLAYGILAHILELRWRVDYGSDLRRSLMAVPYRAKVRFYPPYD